MESSLLEIVELPNGDVVLQRADGEGEPLITLSFSEESKNYLPRMRLEIAKAMIHAGVEAYSHLVSDALSESHEEEDTSDSTFH